MEIAASRWGKGGEMIGCQTRTVAELHGSDSLRLTTWFIPAQNQCQRQPHSDLAICYPSPTTRGQGLVWDPWRSVSTKPPLPCSISPRTQVAGMQDETETKRRPSRKNIDCPVKYKNKHSEQNHGKRHRRICQTNPIKRHWASRGRFCPWKRC